VEAGNSNSSCWKIWAASAVLSVSWDFNEDGTIESHVTSYTFREFTNGLYTVSLTVTDAYSFSQTTSYYLFVSNSGLDIPGLPPKTTLITPANGAVDIPTNASFQWTNVSSGILGGLDYELFVSPNSDFFDCLPVTYNSNNSGALPGVFTVLSLALIPGLFIIRHRFSQKRKKANMIIMIVLIFLVLISCSLPQSSSKTGPTVPLQTGTQYFYKVRTVNQ